MFVYALYHLNFARGALMVTSAKNMMVGKKWNKHSILYIENKTKSAVTLYVSPFSWHPRRCFFFTSINEKEDIIELQETEHCHSFI